VSHLQTITLQHHNSPAGCTKELFNAQKMRQVFVGGIISRVVLSHFGSVYLALGPNHLMEFLTQVGIGN